MGGKNNYSYSLGLRKKLLFTFLATLCFVLLVESLIRVVYYQVTVGGTAIGASLNSIRRRRDNELSRSIQAVETLDAGGPGYTIVDEATLFTERAQHCRPDIVILQVLDDDLFGLTSFKLNSFSRLEGPFPYSPEERSFLSRFLDKEKLDFLVRQAQSRQPFKFW
jgi:hypothetical protein